MFVAAGSDARVAIVVVAYGSPERLRTTVALLVAHDSRHAFEVHVVANPDTRAGHPDVSWLPPGVAAHLPDMNLGWAGGLHLARAAITTEYMAWMQDDAQPRAGWLDALVAAADAHPEVAAFGAYSVDDAGRPDGVAAGSAVPPRDVDLWNETDTHRESLPSAVTTYDWITSKGSLHRLSAWGDVGGPDPRQYPLNHVDKEYSTHLRAHGWSVALVPGARLDHAGSQSSPGVFRGFINGWQADEFNATWGALAEAIGSGIVGPIKHVCHGPWTTAEVERACGVEASRALVPLAKFVVAQRDDELARLTSKFEESTSWRLTAPLRALRRGRKSPG